MALGSPTVKSKALGHHTPDGEHLCLGKFQDVGLLFPGMNFGQIQSLGTPGMPYLLPFGLLRLEVSSLSGWLRQQRNVGPQRPALEAFHTLSSSGFALGESREQGL